MVDDFRIASPCLLTALSSDVWIGVFPEWGITVVVLVAEELNFFLLLVVPLDILKVQNKKIVDCM